MKYNKSQWSWISYDFANSAYHLLIPTVLFPLIYKSVLSTNGTTDFTWSLIISIPVLIVGILAPFSGVLMDSKKSIRKFFIVSVLSAITLTFLLGISDSGNYWLYILIFSLGLLAFNFSQFTYNSFLPSQKKGKGVAKLSGLGWGLGYLGGIVCTIPVYLVIKNKTLPYDIDDYQLAFIIVGVFFLFFSLPSLFFLKNKDFAKNDDLNGGSLKKVIGSISEWSKNKHIFIFLIALYLINDGLSTLVFFTSIFASTTLEMSSTEILNSFLFVQLIGVPATIILTSLSEKIGYMKMLIFSVILWVLIGVSFSIVSSVTQFYILALFVGLVIGTTPALGRAILSRFIENRKDSSEFFGFHTFASRTSAIIGPILFGIISSATGNQKLALLSLGFFFVLGLILLFKVRNEFKE